MLMAAGSSATRAPAMAPASGAAANDLRQRSKVVRQATKMPATKNSKRERRIAERQHVDDDRPIVEHRQDANERQRHAGSTQSAARH